jgi:endogenous inhibitor of DNA gyrase (YacG/DUF329 family)
MNEDLETVVYCPMCGAEVTAELKKNEFGLSELLELVSGGATSFRAESKCPKCGASVLVSVTVSAVKA